MKLEVVAVSPTESSTVTATVRLPAAVGVPEITPVDELILNPEPSPVAEKLLPPVPSAVEMLRL